MFALKTVGDSQTEEELPKADAYIVSFWNSDDAMDMLHTIAMRKTKNGEYELFNYDTWTEKSKVVSNISKELLNEGIVPLSVHCISK